MEDRTNAGREEGEAFTPVSTTGRARFHDGMVASGTRTSEEDIDEELYG